jgi:hypothetical protein
MTTRHKSLTRQRLDFLGEEGYRPRCDDDPGDDDSLKVVTFKSEGQTFLLFVYEDDPDYFNVASRSISAQASRTWRRSPPRRPR